MKKTIQFPTQDIEEHERLPEPERPREKILLDERGMLDMPFLVLTVLLVIIGVIMMFSASYASAYATEGSSTYYFARQGLFAVAGIGIMLFVSRLNYQMWRYLSRPILLVTMGIMLVTPIFGLTGGGATRWIRIGSIRFQPSEVAKLAVIMSYAQLIARYKDKMRTLRGLIPFAGILGVMVLALLFQKHLSGTIIICAVAAAMLFLGGVQVKWFIIALGGFAVLGIIYLSTMGYAAERITAWLDPWSDPQDSGFQIIQSLYAIGSGGLMGLGLGRSRQKYRYLPEEHNDYIFPIVCEELGFVGAVVIILLFAMLIIRGYWIAMHAKDRFGALMVGGISTLMALQVFFNIGVVTNFLPATGISLPFFSYGGTALLIQLFEMGLVLSVSRDCDNNLLL